MKAIITFLKNWTLPSAIVSGTVIYLIFYWVRALDPVSEVMEPIFDTILPLFMSLILFTTFLRVDFHKMRPAMWHLWVSVFQVVFVILIVALILGFDMKGKDLILMEGILTCVICPGASAAPVVTGKLGGNLETMTSYVFLSNLVTVVAVPVVFPLIDKGAAPALASRSAKVEGSKRGKVVSRLARVEASRSGRVAASKPGKAAGGRDEAREAVARAA